MVVVVLVVVEVVVELVVVDVVSSSVVVLVEVVVVEVVVVEVVKDDDVVLVVEVLEVVVVGGSVVLVVVVGGTRQLPEQDTLANPYSVATSCSAQQVASESKRLVASATVVASGLHTESVAMRASSHFPAIPLAAFGTKETIFGNDEEQPDGEVELTRLRRHRPPFGEREVYDAQVSQSLPGGVPAATD